MGSKLETTEGPNLYKFWGTKLTTALLEDLKEGDAVVNTASQEYAKAIDFPMLINQGVKCFECKFLNVGSSCGKRARGEKNHKNHSRPVLVVVVDILLSDSLLFHQKAPL